MSIKIDFPFPGKILLDVIYPTNVTILLLFDLVIQVYCNWRTKRMTKVN